MILRRNLGPTRSAEELGTVSRRMLDISRALKERRSILKILILGYGDSQKSVEFPSYFHQGWGATCENPPFYRLLSPVQPQRHFPTQQPPAAIMSQRHRGSNTAGISFSSESRDTRWRTGAKLQVGSQADPDFKHLPDAQSQSSSRAACCFVQYQSNQTSKFSDANHTIAHVLFSTTE